MGTEIVPATTAAEINRLHHAAQRSAGEALQLAKQAGDLLLEAKAKLAHGAFLPWLEAHVEVTPRQAQKYMRLARRWDELSANTKSTSHLGELGIDSALELLTAPKESELDEEPTIEREKRRLEEVFGGDVWAFATDLIERPFTDYDYEGPTDWFTVKLMHQLRLPSLVSFALGLESYELPLLRLVPYDELREAFEKLAPVAVRKCTFTIQVSRPKYAALIITQAELFAGRFVGALLNELEHRDEIDDATYAAEYETVRVQFVERIQRRMSIFAAIKQRYNDGEMDVDEYIEELRLAEAA